MKKMRGFTLIELLIVVAIIAILAAIAVPNFLEAQVRAKVSRVRSDQRSLATAIEAYYVDHNIYPAFAVGGGGGYNGGAPSYNHWVVTSQGNSGGAATLPSFSLNQRDNNSAFMTLTTPMSYITTYPSDPFATNKGCTFSYASVFPGDQALQAIGAGGRGGVGWILWSFGPDVDEYKQDGPSDSPFHVYEPSIAQPSEALLTLGNPEAYTYDPTNGTVSEGDVWRVKQ